MFLILLLDIYTYGLLLYCILSFIPNSSIIDNVSKGLDVIYKPPLDLLKNVIKPLKSGNFGLDLTPFILFITLEVIRNILVNVFS